MTEKNNQEKMAAARQVELLVAALENAKAQGGVWLNASGKTTPRFYPLGPVVSPFNALVLALHSDANGYKTNEYTLFNEAKRRGESVQQHEKGVPFNWYVWSSYVNRHNAEDVITKEVYRQLPAEQQPLYKGVRKREERILFNIDQTTLPLVDKPRYEKELRHHGTAAERGDLEKEQKALHSRVSQFLEMSRQNLVPIRREAGGVAHYDTARDAIYLPAQKNYADYTGYVQEATRQIVSATGHLQRLAREGADRQSGKTPQEDMQKQELLIGELATGVKLMELGLPARIAPEHLELVDYWVRELKENPCMIDIVESELNRSLNVIHQAERGEKVESASRQTEAETEELRLQAPLHYYVTDELKGLPNADTREVVVVKDAAAKTADVILPSGASLEVNNEAPGMSKERLARALKGEGYEQISFYNPDGALGYYKDDSYFKDKTVAVVKLKNWDLEEVTQLDVSDAVQRAGAVDFEKIMMLRDDAKCWTLYLKPEHVPAVALHPDKEDLNRFFTTLKEGKVEETDRQRLEMAQKYYALSQTHPELKVELFKSAVQDVDASRIERVNIYKTKGTDGNPQGCIRCAVKIKDVEKVEPREVSPSQWQRMWLAEDRQDYKTQLAMTLFSDVLKEKVAEKATASEKQEAVAKELTLSQFASYRELKAKHPDAVFLFRTGDFYVCYEGDAKKAGDILGITLTKYNPDSEMAKQGFHQCAGFPYPALDTYLPKLIRAGERVAICDQIEDARQSRQSAAQEEQANEEQSRRMHR